MTSWSRISSLILRRWLNVCFSSVFKSTWVDYRLRTEFWSSVGLLMLSHFRHSARKFFFQGLKEFAALKLLAQLLHCGLQQLMMQEMKIQNKEEQKIKTTTMKWKWSKTFKLHFTKNTLFPVVVQGSRAAENCQDRLVRLF